MITAKEINIFSERLSVPATTIDKDWVLGHLLAGIFDNSYFQENIVFKGGTCLKKCYFENYRFSEDLDFTSIHIEKRKLISNLKKVTQEISSETGILFGKIKITNNLFKNTLAAYKCTIPFWGAFHPKNKKPPPEERWMSSIKIDFTLNEIICLKNKKKKIIHPYSDSLSNHFATCYSIEEIVSEKFRALLQRNYAAPRDYYDLWYITKKISEIAWGDVGIAFKKKCAHKNIAFISIKDFFDENKMSSCEKEWFNSLNHHLKDTPSFGSVILDLREQMGQKNIHGAF